MSIQKITPIMGENITVAVPVGREKDRLPLLLRNLARFKYVILADDLGAPETAATAAQFGRPVFPIRNKGGWFEFDEWMQAVWAVAQTEYLLMAACPDYMPAKLLETYDEVARTRSYDVVLAKRVSVTDCRKIAIDLPPRWMNFRYKGELRFYRKGSMDYRDNPMHGRGRIICPPERVLVLPQESDLMVYQYRDYDSSETEGKHRVYNDVWAEQKIKKGGPCSRAFTFEVARAAKQFFFCYILYGGFSHGMRGFIHAYYRFHLHLSLAFRFYERSVGALKPDIQQRHVQLRDYLLKRDGL
jgi:hypothetical protein